jgi:hypothetical protein
MVATKPLPVDVVSTWWDYFVDVADLLAGCGTMGALIVAALTFKRQLHGLRQAQASSVTVWLSSSKDGLDFNLLNSSSACVYEVYVTFEAYGRDLGYKYVDVLRPGSTPRSFPVPDEVIHNPEYILDNKRSGVAHENVRARLTFRDSSNQCWRRDRSGQLEGPLRENEVPDEGAKA